MLKKLTLIAIGMAACFGVSAQHDSVKPKNLPDILPTMNYKKAMVKVETGDARAIREAAVLIYLQSPYGDIDTTVGTWDITPQIEMEMNSATIENALTTLMREADYNYVNQHGEAKTGLEVCVWKTRALKLSRNKEIDDQTNFRLMPQAIIRTRTYRTDAEPCINGEYMAACDRNFNLQVERDNMYAKLDESDREACVQHGVNWHLKR